MKLNPNKISFNEFLEIMSGLLEFEKIKVQINYEDTFTGTLSELKEVAKNTDYIPFKKFVHKLNKKAGREFSDVEIINYLAELTKEFEIKRVESALFEMRVFENIVLLETYEQLALLEYERNDWEIPKSKFKHNLETTSYPDYEEMRKKVFPLVAFSFYYAKSVLEKVLDDDLIKQKPKLIKALNLKDFIYKVTPKGYLTIAKNFNFDDIEKNHVRYTFKPIITINHFDTENILEKVIELKDEFIINYKKFNIDIFKREQLEYLQHETKIYLSSLQKRKYNIWNFKNGKYFYHLKLESEIETPNQQTLLITEKDEIELELYLKKINSFIKSFIKEHETNSQNDAILKTKESTEVKNSAEEILQTIWLPMAKISVQQFLTKGKDLCLWDDDFNLTQQRGNKLYGSGKILLGSLAGALKNYAIMESIHYGIIGKAFCRAFNVETKKETKDNYKAFANYNEKYKNEFKRSFNIRF